MANNLQLATDNFASGSLASGWSTLSFGLPAAIGGTGPFFAKPPNGSTAGAQMWAALSWPNDQISEVVIQAVPSSSADLIVAFTRWQSTSVISGYALLISSIGYQVNKYVAGTPTIIGSATVTTVAVGDVWTLTVAGTCLTVYRNGARLAFVYDTQWSSGTPGFWLSDTVPATHGHISSWRGYSFQQQDGIWTKKQIILPANATDLAGTGEAGPQNPTIIQEGNAQLLSGIVYKMWFTSLGVGNAPGAVGYAESTDLLNWTRRSPNVLTATGVGITPFVTKVGSTYHLFDGFATVQRFTSSDGITWVQADANVLTKANLIYFAPVIQVAGTWHAFYSISTGVSLSTTGYATASSITGPWTDQGTILTNGFYGIQQVFLVGSTYYAWGQSVNTNAQSAKPSIDPGEGLMMQSTDLITWTNVVHTIHHSHIAGDLNGVNASEVPGWVLNLNGVAAMIFQINQDDAIATAKSIFQLAIATAPASIQSVVLFPQDGIQQTASDLFIRGAGNLGSNWTTPSGTTGLQIASSGIVQAGTLTTNCVSYYSGSVFGVSQYSEIKILALTTSGQEASPTVYQQSSGLNCYYAAILGATGSLQSAVLTINKLVAGVATALGPTIPYTLQVGDVLRLTVFQGSDGFNVLSLYQNGFLLSQVQDLGNTFTSGNPGALMFATTSLANSEISAWAGGTPNVIPAGLSGSSYLIGSGNRWCTHNLGPGAIF